MKESLLLFYDNLLIYHPNIFSGFLFFFVLLLFSLLCIAFLLLITYIVAVIYFLKSKKIVLKKNTGMIIKHFYTQNQRVNKRIIYATKTIRKIGKAVEREIFLPE